MPRNRPWSKEELILAFDVYRDIGASYKTHPEVIALSGLLNRLSDSSGEADATRFRNPNGVAMKLGNFARLDGRYSGSGLTHGNRLERVVWDEFSTDRELLALRAAEIKASMVTSGVLGAGVETNGNAKAERSYFALNANPDTYRIQDALAGLASDSWTVGRSWLKPGDRVIIWKSYGRDGRAAHRGVVGFGEVVDTPTTRAAPNKYWTDPASGEAIAPRVTVNYVSLSGVPLWEDEHPELAGLTVSGGQGTVFNVTSEQFDSVVSLAGGWPDNNDVDDLSTVQKASRRRGQGYSVCQDCKRAVELRAMELAKSHYKAAGYTVKDVSGRKSYDLRCNKSNYELHVEVKGTTGGGDKVLLTPNEVDHANNYSSVALLIVHSIITDHSPTGICRVAGGVTVLFDPWDINQGELEPTGYAHSPRS